jgi:DNA (cytosine-5)-methyltransferase 1
MNELALFTGAGGGLLGARLLGFQTVCAVELDPYCREVLLRRQEEGFLPPFPIWDDIRTFDGSGWRGKVDVVTAGFPCQPWSVAGKQQGEADDRNLWPDTIRIIREVGPRYCLLENVPALLADQYYGTILGDLAESGFDGPWDCVPASAVGATHRRDRLWVMADAQDANGRRASRTTYTGRRAAEIRRSVCGAWPPRPREVTAIPRVADGVAFRVDRLRALGNGQVPAVVRAAWELLEGINRNE